MTGFLPDRQSEGDPSVSVLAQVRDGLIHTAVASHFDLLVRLSRIGKQRDIADRFLGRVLDIGLGIDVAYAMRDSIERERSSDAYCCSLGFVDQ